LSLLRKLILLSVIIGKNDQIPPGWHRLAGRGALVNGAAGRAMK
jgi:hypothetical protein